MAKKKHIPLFDDQLEMLELLTDQEVGQAVLAAMRFMRSGTETDLTGGAGVVYQVLRAQFIRNQNDAAVGKKGGRPRKSPAETPVSEAETTERNETEPDGTGQDRTEPDETESDRTGGGDGSAGGRFVRPTLDEVRAYVLQRRSLPYAHGHTGYSLYPAESLPMLYSQKLSILPTTWPARPPLLFVYFSLPQRPFLIPFHI